MYKKFTVTKKIDKSSNNDTVHVKPSVSVPVEQISMYSLLSWNISKALKKKPSMDLGQALRSVHERVQRETNYGKMLTQVSESRYLMCALLAWQQLGHKNADSLHQFVTENRNKSVTLQSDVQSDIQSGIDVSETWSNKDIKKVNEINTVKPQCSVDYERSKLSENDSKTLGRCKMGPVVKLPLDTKIVMRLETHSEPMNQNKNYRSKPQKNDTLNKIEKTVSIKGKDVVKRLTTLDTAESELRTRTENLVQREVHRVKILERAEAAWKDLEVGYQQLLNQCEEKEDLIMKQIKELVEERDEYEAICKTMTEKLKKWVDDFQKDKSRLSETEKDLYDKACVRMRLCEESARLDSELAALSCRVMQQDRNIEFNQEQTRRKLLGLESEVDSIRGLTYGVERAMRGELNTLMAQLSPVSKQLCDVEAENNSIKLELESLRQAKSNIIEDLDGCKAMCDSNVQGWIDKLKQKKDELNEIREKVLECRCNLPQDASVQAKRTPSLVGLCICPEDKILDSCSCTSLRSQLLSNLLADLFGGLHSEMLGSGNLMPCQLLKCLQDNHNWDRSSRLKTNLLNFFGKLLTGELDIAIATSIENYHAKWVRASCADRVQIIPDQDQDQGWQERAIETTTQKLATEFAQQLFKEKAEELTKKAKEIWYAGSHCPCHRKRPDQAAYPWPVKQPTILSSRKTTDTGPSHLRRAIQDVTLLRAQIEDLKKDSIKKDDLRRMEEKITKIFQRVSKVEASKNVKAVKETYVDTSNYCTKKAVVNAVDSFNLSKKIKTLKDTGKVRKTQKKPLSNQTKHVEKKSGKHFKKIERSFAVNLCLCGKSLVNKQQRGRSMNSYIDLCPSCYSKKETDIITTASHVRQATPISLISSKEHNFSQESKYSTLPICPSDCVCFNKNPSTTSIDRLLETLTKWKGDLGKTASCNKHNITERNENDSQITHIVPSPLIEKKNISNYDHLNNLNDKYKNQTNNSFNFNKNLIVSSTEVRNKFTTYNTDLPPATDSEYISAINLDKSNDFLCKCNINTDVKHGDGLVAVSSIRYQCINTNSCNCNKSRPLHVSENRSKYENNFVMKNESQIHSSEKDTSNTPSFNKSVEISRELIKNVVQKSECSGNGDCNVKFLGITLANKKTNNKLQKNCDSNALFPKFVNGMDQTINSSSKHDSFLKDSNFKDNNNVRSVLNSCEYENQISHIINCTKDQKCLSLDISKTKEGSCVCCQPDLSSELEVNVFNLLEEHLKRKFKEFERSMCKSYVLPPDKEKELYSGILNKVKQIISEKAVKLTCKCTQETASEGSWSRVYGLLQEYLRIKIKRVQCTCISNNKNIESVLPDILENVNNLIEHDFKILKDKFSCKNKNDNSKVGILNKQMTKGIQESQDKNNTFVQFDVRDTDYLKDKLLQSSNIFCSNKSCETMDNKLFNANTLEKKVSCKLHTTVYGTQCDCRYTFDKYIQYNKEAIVNQCLDLIPNQDKEVNDTSDIISDAFLRNHSPVKSSEPPKEKKEVKEEAKSVTKHPYIGYTLNCSCDRTLGSCHCTKSMVETNNNNIQFIWNSLTNYVYPKKMSYIMPKIVKIRSEDCNLNKNNNYHYNIENNLKYTYDVTKDNKQCCNAEINTIDNEDFVLKDSEEKFVSRVEAFTTETMNAETDPNNETASVSRYSTDTSVEKNKLYNSLYLPIDDYSENAHFDSRLDDNVNYDSDSDKCNCKMVPVCHVKMLVDNIEKKIIKSKCTCHMLLSPTTTTQINFNKDYY